MKAASTGYRQDLQNYRGLLKLLMGLILSALLASCYQGESELRTTFLCLGDGSTAQYAPALKARVTYDAKLACKGVWLKAPEGTLSIRGGRQSLQVQIPVPEQFGGIPNAQLKLSGRAPEPLEVRLKAERAVIVGPVTKDVQQGRVHEHGYSKNGELEYHFFYQVERSDYLVLCVMPNELAASKPGPTCEVRNWRLGEITVTSSLRLSKIEELEGHIDFVNKSVLQMMSTKYRKLVDESSCHCYDAYRYSVSQHYA